MLKKLSVPFTDRKYLCMGGDSVVTDCGLVGMGIECQWERDFLHSSGSALGPTEPPVQWILGVLPGCKAARAWQ